MLKRFFCGSYRSSRLLPSGYPTCKEGAVCVSLSDNGKNTLVISHLCWELRRYAHTQINSDCGLRHSCDHRGLTTCSEGFHSLPENNVIFQCAVAKQPLNFLCTVNVNEENNLLRACVLHERGNILVLETAELARITSYVTMGPHLPPKTEVPPRAFPNAVNSPHTLGMW